MKESIFLVDARESEKALIALAQCNQACAASTTATLPFLIKNPTEEVEDNSADKYPLVASGDLTSACDMQQDQDIRDLTKDFSVCAKAFCHPSKAKSHLDTIHNQSEVCSHEDSAKDCI